MPNHYQTQFGSMQKYDKGRVEPIAILANSSQPRGERVAPPP